MTVDEPPRAVLGRPVRAVRPSSGGYTKGWRGVVTLDDGSTAFVKAATDEATNALRREAGILRWLEAAGSARIGPHLLDFEDGVAATLVVEDLSQAIWPPPYPADTGPLFDALHALGKVEAPPDLTPLETWAEGESSRWEQIAADPSAFLDLNVCSAGWLDSSLPALIEAERRVDLRGTSLVHNDVYSGNVCFVGARAIFVDWATAARGNSDLDIAFAIVSVLAEGGHLPERRLLNDEGAWAARLAGHNAVEAAASLPKWADPGSTLRQDQLVDLRAALPWAARAIGLDPTLGREVG